MFSALLWGFIITILLWSYFGFNLYKKHVKETITESKFKEAPFATLALYLCLIILCGPVVWIIGGMTIFIASMAQLDIKTADKDTK